jgi:hypothetical protein
MNIYVGNLSFDASEEDLQKLFSGFGQVSSVTIVKDKYSGQPRGFGFIEMPVPEPTAENPGDKVGVKGGQEGMAAVETVISREGVLPWFLISELLIQM